MPETGKVEPTPPPSTPGTVAVAMSGGVDSSVAAALLLEAGHRVTGIGLRLPGPADAAGDEPCVHPPAMDGARRVADRLGIPFKVLDYQELFERCVIEPFLRAYAAGETPNPCVRCNAEIKFGALLQHALGLGASHLATGHYARIVYDEHGRPDLRRGVDRGRDQSYFLYRLHEEQLERVLFPVGHLTKARVRELAGQLGLPVATRPSSQDICFVGEADYRAYMARCVPDAFVPGDIVDLEGRVLGRHRGIGAYTIGQRRGLGIAWPEPLYAVAIDARANTVTVAPVGAARTARLALSDITWTRRDGPRETEGIAVQVRYRTRAVSARVTIDAGGATVIFATPLAPVAPGQAAVFYRDDAVLGGGTVVAGYPPEPEEPHVY